MDVMKRLFFVCLLFSCLFFLAAQENPPLAGDSPLSAFPDNWEARRALIDTVRAPRDTALRYKGEIRQTSLSRVRVRVVEEGDNFYFLFENPRGGAYPTYSQGSWVIKRAKRDGSYVQAKIFLRSDPNVFARIYPFRDRAKLEIIVYGAVIHKDVLLAQSFEEVIILPFEKIVQQSAASVNWAILSPNLGLYQASRSMIAAIRAKLADLRYGEDGAIESNGLPVTIKDLVEQKGQTVLNCSGFSKWIVDGLYAYGADPQDPAPLIPIQLLKRRHTDVRGTAFTAAYEDIRDPYFGLDWIRNLGMVLMDKRYPGRLSAPNDQDLSIHPFSLLTGAGGLLDTRLPYDPYPDFAPNIGYQAMGLAALFYRLAIDEPGHFYLGAFSTDIGGASPALTQYYHIAAFFPYFDADGIFRVAVFESAAETSIEAVMRRKPKEFVFLVRLPADSRVDYGLASGVRPSSLPDMDSQPIEGGFNSLRR